MYTIIFVLELSLSLVIGLAAGSTLDFKSANDTRSNNVSFLGTIGSKTYYYDSTLTRRTWNEAAQFCHELGIQMATVFNEEENNFLAESGTKLGFRSINIGATDIFREGYFTWLKSGEPVSYNKWCHRCPRLGSEGRSRNCVAVQTDIIPPHYWYDIDCNHKYDDVVTTICELPSSLSL